MCGIFGAVNGSKVTDLLMSGLQRLEYRGYDSAGLAVLADGHIQLRRAPGKLANLHHVLDAAPTDGRVGIAHTRWATHGVPNEDNAHPHATKRVAVVHNGIVENYLQLREELSAQGVLFRSQTDSEVIPHLVTHYLDAGMSPYAAVRAATNRLHGTFALGVVFSGKTNFLITARRGSPLAIGLGDHANFVASDGLALAPVAPEYLFLEEDDHAVITQNRVAVFDRDGRRTMRRTHASRKVSIVVDKNSHRHYMHKEIYEQPAALRETVRAHVEGDADTGAAKALDIDLSRVKRIQIVACGTSFYAGLVAKYWFEQLAKLPVDVDIASEFRYREPSLADDTLSVFISQSGETADTLAALRFVREAGHRTLAVVNVPQSSIDREAHEALHTHAGPEIGVASTKAFMTQLTVLALLAVNAARTRGFIDETRQYQLITALNSMADRIADVLLQEPDIANLAQRIAKAGNALFLSRGSCFPIALEGALKLKEVSYVHAEGYAAGELKHGPIALIDDTVPVIVIAPDNALRDKTTSNVREVMARRGQVILVCSPSIESDLAGNAMGCIKITEGESIWAPLVYVVPLQLLAYHVALAKGTDVDQPRNLAKSVTVE